MLLPLNFFGFKRAIAPDMFFNFDALIAARMPFVSPE